MLKKILKTIAWSLVGIFAIYTFYYLWAQSQPVPVVYELLKPEVRTIVRRSVATGQVEPRDKVNVKPRITGILTNICVKAGQQVKVGDVIARIQIIPDMTALNEAQSLVESSRLSLEEIERETKRIVALFSKGVVSREEYEQAQNKLELARETLKKFQSALEIVLKGSSSRTGNVNTTVVTSTMNGTIIDLPLKEGASVVSTNPYTDGTTIATIADMTNMIFKGKIDETEVGRLHEGMPICLTLGAMRDNKIAGILEEIATMGVKENGSIMFELKASVHMENAPDVIRAGYSANADIVTDRQENILSIEETAIKFEGGKAYVYCLTSDPEDKKHQMYERIPVEVGLSDGIYIGISKGITDNMIFRGNQVN